MIHPDQWLTIRRLIVRLMDSIDRRLIAAKAPMVLGTPIYLSLATAAAYASVHLNKRANDPIIWEFVRQCLAELEERYRLHVDNQEPQVPPSAYVEDPSVIVITDKLLKHQGFSL